MNLYASRLSAFATPLALASLGLAALLLVLGPGCHKPQAGETAGQATADKTQPVVSSAEDARPAQADEEIWEIHQAQGTRLGYTQTTIRQVRSEGRPLVRIECLVHLAIQRFNQPMESEIRISSLETPDGKPLEFSTTTGQGAAAMASKGWIDGGKLRLRITSTGKTLDTSAPWSPDYGGIQAVEQSLARSPMRPGEQRTVRALDPSFNDVGVNELAAKDYERVQLLGETRELLRIEATTKIAGQSLRGTLWTDRGGEVWKRYLDLMQFESIRTTKEVALGKVAPGRLDFGWGIAVPVDRALERPHETKRIRYRVTLDGDDPAKVFPSGASQQVRSTGPNTAEVTVWAIRPGATGNPDAKEAPPGDGDRQPNNFIQSDHPKVIEAARQGAAGKSDPWQVAVALESHAKGLISKTGYSQAFDTAADVLRSGEGDCTEHAVLLAALARAQGIPARVAMGLVYKDQKLLYHMWTEVYLDGRWIPLDATLARGGIGGAHLKLGQTNLAGASPLSSILPVAQVAGRLKVEILEVE